MSIVCDKCNHSFKRIGILGDTYKNVYGTRCPSCSHLIKPEEKAQFIKKAEKSMEDARVKYAPQIKKMILESQKEELDNGDKRRTD